MFEKTGQKSVSDILAVHEKTVIELEQRSVAMAETIERTRLAEVKLAEETAAREIVLSKRKVKATNEQRRADFMVKKFRDLLSFDGLDGEV